jgi:hypothetical protein
MRLAAFLLGLLLTFAAPALAEERIVNFVSDVTVNTDASLTVHETITVIAEGNEIRRGIFRDFPTDYIDRHGVRLRVGLDVLDVRRDGRDEPFAIESLSNGKRIRIGDKDVFIDPGMHQYDITYRTTRQVGFFETFDELYWNVTGNGWLFPIERAQVAIRLPPGAEIGEHAEYTGRQGSRGTDSRVTSVSGGEYRAETTRRLEPEEGFTVAVAWQKGLVTPPSDQQKLGWWVADNAGYAGLILTLLASLSYFMFAWNKVGRDPPGGTIIPLFRPPASLNPSAVRFIWRQNYDDVAMASGLVGLAVKGRLKISDDDNVYAITKSGSPTAAAANEPLTLAEEALYRAIPSGTTVFRQSNHRVLSAMRQALSRQLKADFEGSMFLRNFSWFIKGALISVIGLAISLFLIPGDTGKGGLFVIFWSAIWWGVIIAVGGTTLRQALSSGQGFGARIKSIFTLLFLIPFVGAGVAVPAGALIAANDTATWLTGGVAIIICAMNFLFYFLMKAPTVAGRKTLDEIEGFRLYMATAEEERLKILHPPEKTPQLFERYLPYAMALDCENAWNAKFAAVLAATAAAGAAAPSWYSGSHWGQGGFGGSLGSGMASSVSSASTAPGSSSGSSGGGSSGGGGGGGGGGGW